MVSHGLSTPSRNRNNEMPGDEELGFEAAEQLLVSINLCEKTQIQPALMFFLGYSLFFLFQLVSFLSLFLRYEDNGQ